MDWSPCRWAGDVRHCISRSRRFSVKSSPVGYSRSTKTLPGPSQRSSPDGTRWAARISADLTVVIAAIARSARTRHWRRVMWRIFETAACADRRSLGRLTRESRYDKIGIAHSTFTITEKPPAGSCWAPLLVHLWCSSRSKPWPGWNVPGSLALLSDAGHNFTDAFGLGLAAAGYYWAAKPGDQLRTFGYQRSVRAGGVCERCCCW